MNGLQMKYFVLKPGGSDKYGEASRSALQVYANVIEQENPQLANDLKNWVDDLIHAINNRENGSEENA